MTAPAVLLAAIGLLLLGWRARGGRNRNGPASRDRRRDLALAGLATLAASLVAACSAAGWFGLLTWIGLLPALAGAIILGMAYRPVPIAVATRTRPATRRRFP